LPQDASLSRGSTSLNHIRGRWWYKGCHI
jgi:hypothetical protein